MRRTLSHAQLSACRSAYSQFQSNLCNVIFDENVKLVGVCTADWQLPTCAEAALLLAAAACLGLIQNPLLPIPRDAEPRPPCTRSGLIF